MIFPVKRLTKREEFAKAVLQGMVSNDAFLLAANKSKVDMELHHFVVQAAVKMADTMIAELSK